MLGHRHDLGRVGFAVFNLWEVLMCWLPWQTIALVLILLPSVFWLDVKKKL